MEKYPSQYEYRKWKDHVVSVYISANSVNDDPMGKRGPVSGLKFSIPFVSVPRTLCSTFPVYSNNQQSARMLYQGT